MLVFLDIQLELPPFSTLCTDQMTPHLAGSSEGLVYKSSFYDALRLLSVDFWHNCEDNKCVYWYRSQWRICFPTLSMIFVPAANWTPLRSRQTLIGSLPRAYILRKFFFRIKRSYFGECHRSFKNRDPTWKIQINHL